MRVNFPEKLKLRKNPQLIQMDSKHTLEGYTVQKRGKKLPLYKGYFTSCGIVPEIFEKPSPLSWKCPVLTTLGA